MFSHSRARALQQYLKANGFDPGPIDGDYGKRTEAALVACQVKRGGTRRPINRIVVHCTATREGQKVTVAEVARWHKARGWNTIGYHRVIYLDGSRHSGRSINVAGAHAYPYNTGSIGVTYVGGVEVNGQTPKDTRTAAQKASLETELKQLAYRHPGAEIVGHRDLSPDKDGDGVVESHEWMKACPSFDAPAEYRRLQIIPSA